MERKKELEWAKAQKIAIGQDLVAAVKQQLKFLAVVDRNRHLYEGPALGKAIYRYKHCWLPLLAKNAESEVTEGPLIVPLDCEWIWHCHRLNPVRYMTDCETLYGRILDNTNIVSSIEGTCKMQTEEIWNKLYPDEPYELDMSSCFLDGTTKNVYAASESTEYDLVSAVKRQIPFFYQVSRSYVNDTLFLEGSVARYKGFLHMIKRNKERSIKRFCVPTYDIDLIWHSHQLHPASYSKDLVAIVGKVLDHDDTDSDRTKGQKLDVGFSETARQWEDTFGSRYWRAGAMYRGSAPSPIAINLGQLQTVRKKAVLSDRNQNILQRPKRMAVEVMLEILAVRDLPAGHEGSLFVTYSKKQPDLVFDTKRRINISSASEEKVVAVFQCEATGEILFELMSYSLSTLPTSKTPILLGTSEISLQDLLNPVSQLQVEKWFELMPNTGVVGSNPISVRIALSSTTPFPSPYVLQMATARPFSKPCLFSLSGKSPNAKSWASFVDEASNELISIHMREAMVGETGNNRLLEKEVIGIKPSGATHVLAEFDGTGWSLMKKQWFFHLPRKFDEAYIFELVGDRKVTGFPGKKLEYETKCCSKPKTEHNFMTAIEFSTEYPYGKAVALFNLKSGVIEIKEEWLLLPGMILAFILSHDLKKEGYGGFTTSEERPMQQTENDSQIAIVKCNANQFTFSEGLGCMENSDVSGACGGGCGGGCGSGCGGGCSSCRGGSCRSGGCRSGGCGSK